MTTLRSGLKYLLLTLALLPCSLWADHPVVDNSLHSHKKLAIRQPRKKETEKIVKHEPAERDSISEAVKDLLKKTDGLVYLSESDEDIEVFVRTAGEKEKPGKEDIATWYAISSDTSVVEMKTFDYWFENWAEQMEEASKEGGRVQDVASFFTNKTKNAKVFRLTAENHVRVIVVVIGRVGNFWIGIRTVATET